MDPLNKSKCVKCSDLIIVFNTFSNKKIVIVQYNSRYVRWYLPLNHFLLICYIWHNMLLYMTDDSILVKSIWTLQGGNRSHLQAGMLRRSAHMEGQHGSMQYKLQTHTLTHTTHQSPELMWLQQASWNERLTERQAVEWDSLPLSTTQSKTHVRNTEHLFQPLLDPPFFLHLIIFSWLKTENRRWQQLARSRTRWAHLQLFCWCVLSYLCAFANQMCLKSRLRSRHPFRVRRF